MPKTMQPGVCVKHEVSQNMNLSHFVQKSIQEKLDGIVNSEVDNAGEISPQTWKIVAHNIAKCVKDSPPVISLLGNIQSALDLSLESFASNTDIEPTSYTQKARSVVHKSVNNEVCDGKCHVLQYEQLVIDISQHSPLEVRKQALHVFLQSVLSEATDSVYWPQIRRCLRENLCDKSIDIFDLSLKVHAKLLQSTSLICVREGFFNLVKGLHLHYSNMYHNSLPVLENGLDGSNPIHHHLSQISYLVLEAVKEMPKNWLRHGERRVEEIVGVFVNLLAMHTYDSRLNLPRDILYPFHILSVLDPKAKWCTHWLHGAFGQHLFFNALSQNSTLIPFLVGEILSYLESYQNSHTEFISDCSIPGHIVKYATFTHSMAVLSKIVCFEKGQQFFPVVVKATSEIVYLEVILLRMIIYLNLHTDYKAAVPRPPPGSAIVIEFIKKFLQNGFNEISGNLMKTIMDPIQNVRMQSMKCNNIPCHTIQILLQLASSSNGIFCLLGSRQTRKTPIANISRNHNSTNTSALGLRKNRMSISLERQFSAQSVRIPSFSHIDMSSPAKVIKKTTAILLKNEDMTDADIILSLIEISSKLLSIHEGLSMLDASNSELVLAVIHLYKQMSFKNELNICSGSRYPFNSKDYCIPSHALYESLTNFIMELTSTPCGLSALAEEDSVLKNLLITLFKLSHVPWEDPHFRRIVSLITSVSEVVSVLADESCRILARPLCSIWNEYEDPVAFITGSERKKNYATQHFINIIYTFVPNLQGIVALLSESECSSSESTLVDADPAPRTLSDLLSFERNVEPWHYISLLTLRALTTNMDVSLYLNNTTNFQEKLLKLQSENVTSDSELTQMEKSRMKTNSVDKFIIIDQCSLLRHQILIATYLVGGPSERILPPALTDTERLDDDSESHLFCSLPPPQLAPIVRKTRITQLKGQTDLQKFLQDTKQGLHDANWLSHARRAYKASCTNDIKACVIIDLLEQVTKLNSNSESYLRAPSHESENLLFPEECLGAQVAIRYGVELRLLQENSQNEENLTQLLHLSHNLKYKKDETFQGFDWFIATVFLLCGGNMDRCRKCIGNISSIPVAPFLWPTLATAKDHMQSTRSHHSFMFGHILELLVKIELPLAFSALQLAGASWWLICRQWMAQCFWNILDWSQICHWLVVSILNQPDFILYFCVSLLRYIQPKILQAASEGHLWEQLMFAPMEGFHVGDQLPFMEKLVKRYRTSVLHHLLASSSYNTT